MSSLLPCLLLFCLTAFGLGWPLAARLRLDPAEKLCAAVLLSLLVMYLAAFAIYLLRLPLATFWILPAGAAAGLALTQTALGAMWRDAETRALLIGQLLVTGWCTSWLFFVTSYSGGGWTGDWYEHWERTRFFLEHWPHEAKFLGVYVLPARPPLANLVTGALLALTPGNFAYYQLFTTLFSSLAFLPAALLVRRFQPGRPGAALGGFLSAVAVFTVIVMVNPSIVQNATFAWTKLTPVSLVLAGLYFYLRALVVCVSAGRRSAQRCVPGCCPPRALFRRALSPSPRRGLAHP